MIGTVASRVVDNTARPINVVTCMIVLITHCQRPAIASPSTLQTRASSKCAQTWGKTLMASQRRGFCQLAHYYAERSPHFYHDSIADLLQFLTQHIFVVFTHADESSKNARATQPKTGFSSVREARGWRGARPAARRGPWRASRRRSWAPPQHTASVKLFSDTRVLYNIILRPEILSLPVGT